MSKKSIRKPTTAKYNKQKPKKPTVKTETKPEHADTPDSPSTNVKHEPFEEPQLKDLTCKHCQQIFSTPMDRLRHSRSCRNYALILLPPQEMAKYFDTPDLSHCPVCLKPLKTRNWRSVFVKHLLVHTTGLSYECRICKKKFRRQDDMRAHEKRHIVAI